MKDSNFEHRGVVERIMPQCITVSIVQETACSACAAAALCHSAENKQKNIDVPCADTTRYTVGQEVVIIGQLSLGLRATLWAYVLPLVLLMAVLIGASRIWESEGVGALAALASMILYYIILYFFRNKLQRTFQFRIKS